ncbi:hypothetical protein JDV09_03205 [Mycobacterium sp. Y57]|uniref:hypothetical protein n=1 Tax=Mycolicibacterium xanthum TaxID=2796469 RepID=UPI001C851023|nr:hypothetical protein [Mycolicibacterium xanthum]MBX7431122.1 hypothetical protein [Mycolicibacterium xanthum]
MTTTITRRYYFTRSRRRPSTPADILKAEIAAIGLQIDRCLSNPTGTAEKGVYFWHWPPTTTISTAVLTRLHADAADFLHSVVVPDHDVETADG